MNRQILNLAIPNIITNVTIPLLGMVDSAIAGHLESELYIGAVAVAAMIFNFIYWNFSFLRMGTSGFTAQAYGADNKKETVNILLRSLLVAFVAGLIIIMLQPLLLWLAFLFIKATPQTQAYAAQYFHVYIWAAPFVLGTYAMTGWYIGMQDAKTPMFVAITTNLINILLSVIFVFVFNMQLRGLALGTALAQVCGFALTVILWNKKYSHLKQYLSSHFIKNLADFKPFFKVNTNIFLRSLGLILVTVFFTSASAAMGDMTLAANSLLMQFFMLFSFMMDGFAYAAEALAGKYFGARDKAGFNTVIKYIFMWGGGVTLVATAIYALFMPNVLALLTDKVNIIAAAQQYRWWAVFIPLAGFAAFLWDGIFVGITASRQMRNAMFAAVALFFILFYLLSPYMGNNALWLAFICYLAARGVMQTLMFRRVKKQVRL
ncbi:MATE family multidrug resistance protein [Elusimicrobium simillimum]|uniref:MATE family efflux transporter n=1 Tax=Elusimicrobium simillimum TaxID=3143438 RepID=UPI003C6F23AD